MHDLKRPVKKDFFSFAHNMFFLYNKKTVVRHILEHFILQLLEAFKHGNSPSLPRNFPSRLESVVSLPTFREHFAKMVKLNPPVHFHGGVVHWQPSPFCSCLTLKTKEWPLEL